MITNRHRIFARTVVEQARAYCMTEISMTFRLSVSVKNDETVGPDRYETVTMSWSEGRHGAKGRIELRAQQTEYLNE